MKKLSFVIVALLLFSCKEAKEKQITTEEIKFEKEGELQLLTSTGDTIRKIDIEIADNAFERETGLMYRSELKEDHGMLFIFEDERPRGFYMKNTTIPLDIIFLNAEEEIINIAKNTEPLNENTVPSEAPAQYVLEINSGLADLWQIKAGDKISYKTTQTE